MSDQPVPARHEKPTFGELALDLLHVLDPGDFSINCSKHGIAIYHRAVQPNLTPWERMIWTGDHPLPAVWIGYLSAILRPTHRSKEISSLTPSLSRTRSAPVLDSLRGVAVDSSRMQRFARTAESRSDGQTLKNPDLTGDA